MRLVTYLRHPDRGLAASSSLDFPYNTIVARIHANTKHVPIKNIRSGTIVTDATAIYNRKVMDDNGCVLVVSSRC